jgi:hypothetical protein
LTVALLKTDSAIWVESWRARFSAGSDSAKFKTAHVKEARARVKGQHRAVCGPAAVSS